MEFSTRYEFHEYLVNHTGYAGKLYLDTLMTKKLALVIAEIVTKNNIEIECLRTRETEDDAVPILEELRAKGFIRSLGLNKPGWREEDQLACYELSRMEPPDYEDQDTPPEPPSPSLDIRYPSPPCTPPDWVTNDPF